MSEDFEVDENTNQPRPGFLTALCVLSFISIGIGVLSGFVNLILGPSSAEAMLEARVEFMSGINEMKNAGMDSFAGILEQFMAMTEDVNNNFYLAGILNFAIVLLGLFGVIKMFKGQKLGFHIYIVYCLLSVGSVYAYVSPGNIPTFVVVTNLILSGLFVLLYSRNLKWMK